MAFYSSQQTGRKILREIISKDSPYDIAQGLWYNIVLNAFMDFVMQLILIEIRKFENIT